MKLSKTDKIILESYAGMVEYLSDYLGSAYEISLHSLEDYDHSVIRIMNGYHSGRAEGAPITDLALNMLKRITEQGIQATRSYASYRAIAASGERLRSSTIPVTGEHGRVIGLICINFYMDSPFSEVMQAWQGTNPERLEEEHLTASISETVSQAVADARNQVLFNPNIPAVNRNKEIIRILDAKGIFHIKNAVVLVAQALGISKNTVYLHLRGGQKEPDA